MNLTRSRLAGILRKAAFLLVVCVVVGYAVYRSLPLARGPVINIFEPVNGASISSSTVLVSGQALRVNSIALNGNPISIDEEGNFKDALIVFPGLNLITFEAMDKFNRSHSVEIRIFGSKNLPQVTERDPKSLSSGTSSPQAEIE